MCRRVSCEKCGRPTFAGCGAHVEAVLGDVPVDQRCHCHEARSVRATSDTRAETSAVGKPPPRT